MTAINSQFQWKREPEAERLILQILETAKRSSPFLSNLEKELRANCSTDLLAWIDHVVVDELKNNEGFQPIHTRERYQIWRHPLAKLPDLVVDQDGTKAIAIAVESIADFLNVRGLTCPIEGSPYSGFRRSLLAEDNEWDIWVIERRGVETIEAIYEPAEFLEGYFEAKELWMTRPRHLEEEEEQLQVALSVADQMVEILGEDAAAALVLECERSYWQARNHAAQIQKNRQDRVGMGWANHDHHTFRSSRRNFAQLVKLFEILGFHCRERFYAGEEAGWGAQVMENPKAKLVLFLDVDLSPEEIAIDFAKTALPETKKLGTVGLWCALHGDSILKSGMHHLEAQFDFENLTEDLKQQGIAMMEPFSNFEYLKQAFTKGETWQVDPARINNLLNRQLITFQEADKFKQGAIGSHLENLQRKEGYKGFNQKNVSLIIRKTDPRHVESTERDAIPKQG